MNKETVIDIIACKCNGQRATAIRINRIATFKAAMSEPDFRKKLATEILEGSQHLLLHPPVDLEVRAMQLLMRAFLQQLLTENTAVMQRFLTVQVREREMVHFWSSRDTGYPEGDSARFVATWDLCDIPLPH